MASSLLMSWYVLQGSFDLCLTDEIQGGYDVYKGPKNLDPAVVSGAQWPVNEPLLTVPAMAAATSSIGFGVTLATTYEQVCNVKDYRSDILLLIVSSPTILLVA